MHLALKAFGSAECLKHCWNCLKEKPGMIQNYSIMKNEVFLPSLFFFFSYYNNSDNDNSKICTMYHDLTVNNVIKTIILLHFYIH